MKKTVLAIMLAAVSLAACDDSTSSIGYDVIPKDDEITAVDSVFHISTQTVQVDKVLANTSTCYLGSIVDPETHIQTISGFLAQFHLPDGFRLPSKDILVCNEQGEVEADSCDIRLYLDSFLGDSLTTMKLRVDELSRERLLSEDESYYTNLNADDYILSGGVNKTISYTVKDLTRPDNETNGKSYYRQIAVKLPKSYGTKLMQAYYNNKADFANSATFMRNVCAGFSFKNAGGKDVMVKTAMIGMNVYFRYHSKTEAGNDTIIDGAQRFGATEEVLQTTHINNNYPGSLSLSELQQKPCTYVKSPASFFTEMTLPVDEVVDGKDLNGAHYNDSISMAQVIIRRKTVTEDESSQLLPVPDQLLLVRKSDWGAFFEQNRMPDSKTTYLSSMSTDTKNYYAYSNIAPLIAYIKAERDKKAGVVQGESNASRRAKYAALEASDPTYAADWNKVYLIPVDAVYTKQTSTTGTTTSVLRSVKNQLGLTSVQLEGGNDNPLQMQVIYSRYNK